VNRQLVIAGAWMKMYGQQPELLLMLGKFCAKLQLWGRAKDYFTKCLAIRPNADATLEYGRLLEKLGESDQATVLYRDNLVAVAEESGSACSPLGLT
jgi:HemY protein